MVQCVRIFAKLSALLYESPTGLDADHDRCLQTFHRLRRLCSAPQGTQPEPEIGGAPQFAFFILCRRWSPLLLQSCAHGDVDLEGRDGQDTQRVRPTTDDKLPDRGVWTNRVALRGVEGR